MKKFVAGSLIALGVAAASAHASPVYQVKKGREHGITASFGGLFSSFAKWG